MNQSDCRSTARPVVLLHGTFASVAASFTPMVGPLRNAGRCVYGVNYGNGGVGAVPASAQAFATFVRTVLAATGVPQVDVIAYSQGGLVLRTALREDDLASDVSVAVLLAPSFHGTTAPVVAQIPASFCPACHDQAAGSDLLRRLDAGGDLDGSVRYAVVSTRNDTVVTPLPSQVPQGPADRVRSVVVQDRCPNDPVDHVHLPADPGVIAWTVAALRSDGHPAADALTC